MNIVLILLGIAVLILVISKGKKSKSNNAPNKATGWQIMWSPGMSGAPTPQGSGWAFDFPTNPASHVHYVQNFNPPKLTPGHIVTVKFKVDGDNFIPQEFPEKTALVSILIQRKGDDWSAKGKYAAYRWFSNATAELIAGEYVLSVPLDVNQWGDVYGGKDTELFTATLNNVESIGLVFGSEGGRGHGVYSHSPSRFTLNTLTVSSQ